MIVCILARDEDVAEIRATALANIPGFVGHNLLNMPLSSNGLEPITHWFCQFVGSQEMCDKILVLQNKSIMEINSPGEFLKKHNLQLVRKR